MSNTAADVLMVQAFIKLNGRIECVHELIGIFAESSAPEFSHYLSLPCFINARTVSGRPNSVMKPVASAWL